MVPVDSRGISRVPRYSGTRVRVQSAFAYVVITLYDRLFQAVRLAAGLVTLWFYTDARPTTPSPPLKAQNLRFEISEEDWVWAVPLSLAATDGIAVALFSSRY